MLDTLQVATIVLVAVVLTPALAHALEWPGKKRLGVYCLHLKSKKPR